MRFLWFMLGLTLVACGGPSEATLIDELRVVAAVAEPPDVLVNDPYRLTLTVADPLEEGGDWLAWTCLPETDCIRTGGVLEGETVGVDAVGIAPVPLWFMACAPGACDLPGATEDQLRDPTAWLTDLPLTGVTLGSRFPRLVEEGDERNSNPVITRAPEGLSAKPEEEVTLGFDAPGSEQAYGYTTGGGFTMQSYDVGREGNTELIWVAPEDAGIYRLYVVFDDGAGGTTVWVEDVEVR